MFLLLGLLSLIFFGCSAEPDAAPVSEPLSEPVPEVSVDDIFYETLSDLTVIKDNEIEFINRIESGFAVNGLPNFCNNEYEYNDIISYYFDCSFHECSIDESCVTYFTPNPIFDLDPNSDVSPSDIVVA